MPTPRSPARRDGGQRAHLIEAAGRLVAREGIAAATTRRIAQEAGVPAGLVHYWFAGKDELLEEVVRSALGDLQQAALTAGQAPGTHTDLLAGLRAAFAVVQADEPGRQLSLYELTTWALRAPHLTELARAQYTAYRETAAAGTGAWLAATGAALPGDPELLARFVAVLFDGVTLAWLADPEGTRPDEIFAFVSELLTRAAG